MELYLDGCTFRCNWFPIPIFRSIHRPTMQLSSNGSPTTWTIHTLISRPTHSPPPPLTSTTRHSMAELERNALVHQRILIDWTTSWRGTETTTISLQQRTPWRVDAATARRRRHRNGGPGRWDPRPYAMRAELGIKINFISSTSYTI